MVLYDVQITCMRLEGKIIIRVEALVSFDEPGSDSHCKISAVIGQINQTRPVIGDGGAGIWILIHHADRFAEVLSLFVSRIDPAEAHTCVGIVGEDPEGRVGMQVLRTIIACGTTSVGIGWSGKLIDFNPSTFTDLAALTILGKAVVGSRLARSRISVGAACNQR